VREEERKKRTSGNISVALDNGSNISSRVFTEGSRNISVNGIGTFHELNTKRRRRKGKSGYRSMKRENEKKESSFLPLQQRE